MPDLSLYNPEFEHDACGVGFVANLGGQSEHRILAHALQALGNLAHRGALDADAMTGDGSGVLTQLPHAFLRREMERSGARLPCDSDPAVGVVFLPQSNFQQAISGRKCLEAAAARFGLDCLGWRSVPVNPSCLGQKARATMPDIRQVFLKRPAGCGQAEFERRLLLVRRTAERYATGQTLEDFYIASLSSRTIVYKGLLSASQLGEFYPDLADPLFTTALALYHQRYSTNTFPQWRLAHPFRLLAHNGEINTLSGNKIWTRAREQELASPLWGGQARLLKPLLQPGGSDSACLDNALELLQASGRSLLHSVMMLVPEAWENSADMPAQLRAFYRFHACLNEPWDGPAALVFSDGRYVGAALDRNGLRPARYKIYRDGLVVFGSEAGVLPIDEAQVLSKGRLGPGQILALDTLEGELLDNDAVKQEIAASRPYEAWCRGIVCLPQEPMHPAEPAAAEDAGELTRRQIAFGWDNEELREMIQPMASTGAEPIGSMGDDTPLAVFSKRPRLLSDYFKQRFAQVTNPPIDSIREKNVMSLGVYLGRRLSWLTETEAHAKLIQLPGPFLFEHELAALRQAAADSAETISCLFDAGSGVENFEAALNEICARAERAVEAGKTFLVLTDRGVNAAQAPVPMLLAVGAVHHRLLRRGKRLRASIVCETGEARDLHQFACLIGCGASAIHPYLALETIRANVPSGESADSGPGRARANFRRAIEGGLLKVMAKMGISTLSSYCGAQLFEIIGLSRAVVDRCFEGTPSQIGGLSLRQIGQDALRRHAAAFGPSGTPALDEAGNYKVGRNGQGEFHVANPQVVMALHRFNRTSNPEEFFKYLEAVQRRPPVAPRDLLRFRPGAPIPLETVEPIESIRRRFTTAGMSLGSLSPEVHECIAIAMNSIGGKSNCGEGGESPERFRVRPDGRNANSAIKQVASGRFGVTPEYLASAQELEIKMAQGAKPGEGGQLPGHKVSPMIAQLRHCEPGVTLISPPPHHDIYSIEDLAQLIYDLKQVNPRAKVCVKLVAEPGVGTIAAGVAKACADVVLISGHDGGTGASSLSSIKHAGGPFELGIAEAHQTLLMNALRSRVVLRTDGGLKTGRDILMAAILGAQEFNFGTAALIAAGCAMFRICHTNRCPVGVATQDEELRKKYRGKPENVVSFFNGVAGEVRELLAQLGFRTLEEIIGRTDLVEPRPQEDFPEELRERVASIDLRKLLGGPPPGASRWQEQPRAERPAEKTLDDQIVADAAPALSGQGRVQLAYLIHNRHRSIGTRLSGLIGQLHGGRALPEGSIDVTLRGSAGQSLGAFLAGGITLRVFGEANDFVGKGMSGGEIIIRPPESCGFCWAENVLVGNTVLYGATGGRLFVAGVAGERFCVRNSGAVAVVEGVGDHGCEYMTAGTAVVLGRTGRNFGAGMSGGRAFVYDPENQLPARLNPALVRLDRLAEGPEILWVRALIQEHLQKTGSPRAAALLAQWDRNLEKFWRVAPRPVESGSSPAAAAAAPAASAPAARLNR